MAHSFKVKRQFPGCHRNMVSYDHMCWDYLKKRHRSIVRDARVQANWFGIEIVAKINNRDRWLSLFINSRRAMTQKKIQALSQLTGEREFIKK